MAHPDVIDDEKQEKLLAFLMQYPNVSAACRAIGVSRRTYYATKRRNQLFSDMADEAIAVGIEAAEDEAWQRAIEGHDEPVTYQGEITDWYKKKSDGLLQFMLKAHKPEKYRERYEHSGPDGEQLQQSIVVLPGKGSEGDESGAD